MAPYTAPNRTGFLWVKPRHHNTLSHLVTVHMEWARYLDKKPYTTKENISYSDRGTLTCETFMTFKFRIPRDMSEFQEIWTEPRDLL